MIRPGFEVCKPTGVLLGPGKRVFIVPDRGGAGEALAEKLRALGVEVVAADSSRPVPSTASTGCQRSITKAICSR